MADRINPSGAAGVRPLADQGPSAGLPVKNMAEAVNFEAILDDAEEKRLRFSKHAAGRIERREIPLSKDDLTLLSEGIARAEEKGSRESLLLMDDTAFVVNVKSRTIITAVDERAMKEKTFTNIDSAILLTRK